MPLDVPLYCSPDGEFGYIPVHKCASTTYKYHFYHRLRWDRAWRKGSLGESASRWWPNPDPRKILVITRPEPDRFLSGLHTMNHTAPWAEVDWDNQHVWPIPRFIADWQHFYDRMEFVDMHDVPAWLERHGLPATQERRNAR